MQIAASKKGRVTLGQALFDVVDSSSSSPVWAYGAGYLWLYEFEGTTRVTNRTFMPRNDPRVFQISETSRRVVRTFSAPSLVRPLGVANRNGASTSWAPDRSVALPRGRFSTSHRATRGCRLCFTPPSPRGIWILLLGHSPPVTSCGRTSAIARQEGHARSRHSKVRYCIQSFACQINGRPVIGLLETAALGSSRPLRPHRGR
jgi:hypothetical protein